MRKKECVGGVQPPVDASDASATALPCTLPTTAPPTLTRSVSSWVSAAAVTAQIPSPATTQKRSSGQTSVDGNCLVMLPTTCGHSECGPQHMSIGNHINNSWDGQVAELCVGSCSGMSRAACVPQGLSTAKCAPLAGPSPKHKGAVAPKTDSKLS